MKHGNGTAPIGERDLFRIQRALESKVPPLEWKEVLDVVRNAREVARTSGVRVPDGGQSNG